MSNKDLEKLKHLNMVFVLMVINMKWGWKNFKRKSDEELRDEGPPPKEVDDAEKGYYKIKKIERIMIWKGKIKDAREKTKKQKTVGLLSRAIK